MQNLAIFLLLTFMSSQHAADRNYTMLCLGDSYTIGQSVAETERFPEQTVALLKNKNIAFDKPYIIARTGWNTKSLINATKQQKLTQQFDFVTLLTGVNDQYQEIDTTTYKINFEIILQMAVQYAGGKKDHMIVLSIPDYGVTPFALNDDKSPKLISAEIDNFNAINKRIAAQYGVHYIDINPISKKAAADESLLANDGLHPSGKMYKLWSALLAEKIAAAVK